jgi:hypothetical protein
MASMKNIIDHLQKGGAGVFLLHEMTEPLMLIYNILRWAVRDQADLLIVHPNLVAWYKGETQIGEFHPQVLIPIIGFTGTLEQIILRDHVVKNMLRLISKEADRTTYKILY